jgi:hypothetical protein
MDSRRTQATLERLGIAAPAFDATLLRALVPASPSV